MNIKNKNHHSPVSILMSTYNGEMFLDKQIDSILNQTHKNFKLIIRDDGSSDETLTIINDYLHKYPNVVSLLKDTEENIGSTKSFLRMLNYVDDESYVMFSDQDDIWFENKIALFLSKIQELESSNVVNKPTLVFGDMIVTDNNLNILDKSFWHFQKIKPQLIYKWKKVLSQNVVTGCSMIINSSGRKISQNLPADMNVVHDHFIAIMISKNGLVSFIKEPSMYYVQHNNNQVGASDFNFDYILNRVIKLRETLFEYHKLCSFFKMNFFNFIYFKLIINVQRIFIN